MTNPTPGARACGAFAGAAVIAITLALLAAYALFSAVDSSQYPPPPQVHEDPSCHCVRPRP